MKRIAIVLSILVLLCGCENGKENYSNTPTDETLESILERENYIIVDVRTKTEYEEGHIVGAINVPYDSIDAGVDLDKEKTVMVYCKSGRRSSIAYERLKKLGYDVYDLGTYDSIDLEKE